MHPHLSEVNNFSLVGGRVSLDDSDRCADTQRSIQNIHSKDDRIPLTKRSDDLEPARPNSLGGRILTFGFDDLCIVRSEGVKEMVDDIGFKGLAPDKLNAKYLYL